MPNQDELTDYAKKLPQIYRDILTAFPEIEPRRKAGYGLAFQTLAIRFANTKRDWVLGEVQDACKQLAENGFVEIKNAIFVHPTELGEQLIAVLTGESAAPSNPIPRLPARTW